MMTACGKLATTHKVKVVPELCRDTSVDRLTLPMGARLSHMKTFNPLDATSVCLYSRPGGLIKSQTMERTCYLDNAAVCLSQRTILILHTADTDMSRFPTVDVCYCSAIPKVKFAVRKY